MVKRGSERGNVGQGESYMYIQGDSPHGPNKTCEKRLANLRYIEVLETKKKYFVTSGISLKACVISSPL